ELIVGGALNHDYPAKGTDLEERPVVLDVANLSGNGFRNVTMLLRRGEIVGLAGIDANGQREFVRAVAGLGSISDGTAKINGRAVRLGAPDRAAANGIGYLPGD